jgi:hypothetical protein
MSQPSGSFNQLDPVNKILALLGTVKDPISQELTLTLAGVSLDDLDLAERTKIEAVFFSPIVQRLESNEYGVRYKLKEGTKKELSGIDWRIIQREIKSALISGIFKN